MKGKIVRKINMRKCLAELKSLKKSQPRGLVSQILPFFTRAPPSGLFQLAQKQFITGVLKEYYKKFLELSQENFLSGL